MYCKDADMIENMGIAQLVERMVWDYEAAGSIPASRIERLTRESHTFITGWPLVFYK